MLLCGLVGVGSCVVVVVVVVVAVVVVAAAAAAVVVGVVDDVVYNDDVVDDVVDIGVCLCICVCMFGFCVVLFFVLLGGHLFVFVFPVPNWEHFEKVTEVSSRVRPSVCLSVRPLTTVAPKPLIGF